MPVQWEWVKVSVGDEVVQRGRTCCAVVDGDDALEGELPAGRIATPIAGNRGWEGVLIRGDEETERLTPLV